MATNLNLDSLKVDSSGRASFSGLGSGIDLQGTVDSIIEAKRIPIDRIEQRISDNQVKVAALQDLSSLTRTFKSTVEQLRGAITFDRSADIFEAKQAFATTSRDDSATPSAAADIVGVTLTNAAQATSHSIEVQQIAAAHKVASDSVAGDLDDELAYSGTFEINGQEITVEATDSLFDLRDRINAASAGVTASIVTISDDEHVLILTADDTGTDAEISVADTGGSVLQDLGIIDGAGDFQNELQAARNAELLVDGLGTTIERQSNTVDDVFAGVTLSLFKAEVGTTINLDVESDLNQVKSAIVDFVDA
jgi:flagellar hook-associated protein 2